MTNLVDSSIPNESNAQYSSFLKEVYHNQDLAGEYLEFRFIPPKDTKLPVKTEYVMIQSGFEETLDEVKKVIRRNEKMNCYFGVATRTEQKGSTQFCGKITTFYADFDEYQGEKFKKMDHEKKEDIKAQLIKELQQSSLPPSYIISSGNGIHAYWLTTSPIEALKFQLEIEAILKYLANLIPGFDGDNACTRLAQVMRLPGTWNVKDEANKMLCEIIEANPNRKYEFESLRELANVTHSSATSTPLPSKVEQVKSLYQGFQELDVDYEDFEQVALQNEFFKTLYEQPDLQSYELWLHLASNCSVFGEFGRELFHGISCGYEGYTEHETDRMFDGVLPKIAQGQVGPTTYKTIQEAGLDMRCHYTQASPAGTVLSTLKMKFMQQKNDETIQEALEALEPGQDEIANLRLAEEFIEKHLQSLKESLPIKTAYLKQMMSKLGIPEKGNIGHFKDKLKKSLMPNEDENLYIKIGEEILAEKPLMNVGGKYYEYKSGHWVELETDINTIIVNKLGDLYTKSAAGNILFYLSAKTNVVPSQVNQHRESHLIPLQNGMLDLSGDQFGDVRLLPHKKEYYCLNLLNIPFDQAATCPRWQAFLQETFSSLEEDNRNATIGALQEFMGYLLIAGNEFQKMMFLIGKPRTGKRIIMSIMNALLGDENVSAVPIGDLHDKVNTILLFDKLANIGGEIDEKEKFKASFVKSLTGEDKVQGKALYCNPISFYNEAKLIFSSNHLPRVLDKSDAIYERSLCIPVNEYVPQHKRDPKLKDKLAKELSGILNWAIQGRMRLFQRGYFVESPSMIALREQMKEENNSVVYWFNRVKDQLDAETKVVTLKELFEKYKSFCLDEEMKPLIRKNFKKVLESISGLEVYHPSKPDQDCVRFHWDEINGEKLRKSEKEVELNKGDGVTNADSEVKDALKNELDTHSAENVGISELDSEAPSSLVEDMSELFKSLTNDEMFK